MLEIVQTEEYVHWFNKLKDRSAKARIDIRIRRLSLGNFGDVKSVGSGISELRIPYGLGYRVYFAQEGKRLIILLIGGDKSTQANDIAKAIQVLHELQR